MEFELIRKDLQNSGSLVAKNKPNSYFQTNIEDEKGGFVYAPSKKRVYNTDELKKTIDINVVELIPDRLETEFDLVPRPLYNDATRSLELANETIASQSVVIGGLEAQVSELTAISASLDVQLDNERLLRVTAESNAEQLRKQFVLVNDTMQTSLQRSVSEGIEKTGLQARNEGQNATIQSLQKQVDSLGQQLNGKNARLAEGAKAGADITVRVIEKSDPAQKDLYFDVKTGQTTGKWLNGPTVEIFNTTLETQTVQITIKNTQAWIGGPSMVTVEPQEKVEISIQPNFSVINGLEPKPRTVLGLFGGGQATNYTGTLVFKTTNGEVALSCNLYKHRS
jgi:hypothetical protein